MSGVNVFENALNDLSSVLKRQNVPYMIIGGLANAILERPGIRQKWNENGI